MLQKKVNLFGVFIDDISKEDALVLAMKSLSDGEARSFFTPNLEMLDGARRSEGIRRILNGATVCLPDGIGVNMISKLLGTPIKSSAAGIDFGEMLIERAAKTNARVFLLGGRRDVAEAAAENLKKRHQNLVVCGVHHGYFSSYEAQSVIEQISSADTDILFVCMGFPRQEKFVYEMGESLRGVKVFACLGGALDVWSGEKTRAPVTFRRYGLEWLWRIICEPSRAERFILSLPTLFIAFSVAIKNIPSNLRIKSRGGAYNRMRN